LPVPHGRPFAAAFNVVMATAIVSTAALGAGLHLISSVLAVVAAAAFALVAALDIPRALHPITMLHRARQPGRAFPALGFVADTCVLGTRIVTHSGPRRVMAVVLLLSGAVVWLSIALELGRYPGRVLAMRGRAEWLLATVATEGIAILLSHLSPSLHWLAVALWALGGVLYLLIADLLVVRLRRFGLRPDEFSPDWWIVMGAPAIFALSAGTLVGHGGPGSPIGVLGLIAWSLASALIPMLGVLELWRARTLRPRFTPERWTMVFPLGMYSACSQLCGKAFGYPWMHQLGQAWIAVALAAWIAVAGGELHFAFRPRR
jgi:tellurite resistance protein TehA-like permease